MLFRSSQVQLAHRISAKGYSVREAERLVQHELNPPKQKAAAAKKEDRDVARLEEELADSLGAHVRIRMGAKGAGQIAIGFSSLDQLDGLLEKLR